MIYQPRSNLRTLPVLAKRCCICGRFLFKRNLGKHERVHRANQYQLMCNSCYVALNKEELSNEENRTEGTQTQG